MKVDIKTRTIEVPIQIRIDGKDYPITKWNVDTIRKYWETKDEEVLKNLKDFCLDFS